MDIYFVNCFLACTIAFFAGNWYAERKFKRVLANMLMGRGGATLVAPKGTVNH